MSEHKGTTNVSCGSPNGPCSLVVALEERTKQYDVQTREHRESMSRELTEIKEHITEVKTILESKFVTQKEFWPVKTLVYGMTGIILIAVVTALVAIVVNEKPTAKSPGQNATVSVSPARPNHPWTPGPIAR